ncbi:prepilin-type N-terminal cleavage/methylation domain-containing protein [Geminocystis herdmanii]|uniref:prepilin-type N-terminal cleavage/methylation domain-containing protein n=1 Tax=Geminocystis herdmanii TaxID=669359 RepID=UPI00034CE10E|nr:type IV pilin-like G/H family protein [Geminocystis herdmanii]
MSLYYQWVMKLSHGKKINQGFTLIELLVVVIIVGILAAAAIPNFINQIGKSRESETKSYLGLIARAQQGYHWEKGTFATQVQLLGTGSLGGVTAKYHNIPDPTDVSNARVKHQAFALNGQKDQVRNFAVGVYYDAGQYTISLCQSIEIDGTVNVGDSSSADCVGTAVKLK